MKNWWTILLFAAAVGASVPARAQAQDPATEKALIANERAINGGIVKGDPAAFKEHVAADGWAIDSMSGRMPTAQFLKDFAKMTAGLKITKWDITEPKVIWVDANTAVVTYKWTGTGTYEGKPIPPATWASTVWTKKNGKWTALFHQESNIEPPPSK
jgi:hypothetical protein